MQNVYAILNRVDENFEQFRNILFSTNFMYSI
jgi:hypothetical protein